MYIALSQNLLYTDNSLQKYNNHFSGIGLGRMTISVVSCKFDSDNMDFVELEH